VMRYDRKDLQHRFLELEPMAIPVRHDSASGFKLNHRGC